MARRIGYWVLALLAVLVALASMRFLSFDPAVLDAILRPNLVEHPIPFWIHVTLGPVALLLGIWQFLPMTRRSAYHRWAGRLYVLLVLVSALAGFVIAFTTAAGPAAATAFAILAVLWFGATLVAWLKVRQKRYAEHRRWMIRSYALTCAAITLRLIIPTGMGFGLDFLQSYVIAAWGCWIINLAIAELLIRRLPVPQIVPRAA